VGLTEIGGSAFFGCTSLALTELPAGLTEIGFETFFGCTSLALTELPAGLTRIGSSAFYGCTGLTVVTLPAGLSSIGGNAFNGCTNLSFVTCRAVTPPGRREEYDYLGDMFYNTHSTLRIEVPAESVDAYKAAQGWSQYASRIFAIGDNK
jgi:hypothetical protein